LKHDRKNRFLRRPGIKWSLFASFLAFSLILVALLWMFQIVFLGRFYRAVKTAQIRRIAATVADNINHSELDTLINRIAEQGDLSIRIFTVSGSDLASIEIGPASLINHLALTDLFNLYDKTVAAGGEYLEFYNRSSFDNDRYDERKFVGNVPPPTDNQMTSLIFCRQVTLDNGTSAVILLEYDAVSGHGHGGHPAHPADLCLPDPDCPLLGLALFLSRRIARPSSRSMSSPNRWLRVIIQSGLAPGITGKSANWLKPSTIRWLSWGVSKPCAAN